MACQRVVRNEGEIVTFEGDQTLPAQGHHITHAASRFKGGMDLNTNDEFLAYAVKVEEDAAMHFDKLASEMDECGNQEVAKLFRQLAGGSRLPLAEAKSRAGSFDVSKNIPPDGVWPKHATPERTEHIDDPGKRSPPCSSASRSTSFVGTKGHFQPEKSAFGEGCKPVEHRKAKYRGFRCLSG